MMQRYVGARRSHFRLKHFSSRAGEKRRSCFVPGFVSANKERPVNKLALRPWSLLGPLSRCVALQDRFKSGHAGHDGALISRGGRRSGCYH